MPPSNSTISKVQPLLATVLRPLPLLPLQPLLALTLDRIGRRHPGIFKRLGIHAGKRFGLRPIDLPFAFVLEPRLTRPRVIAVRHLPEGLDVRVSGPLAGLVGLVTGTLDGDALFFSRDLHVEGDIEALLALRNTIDDAQIDLVGEALDGLGPFKAPAERFVQDWLRPVAWS
jgi:predicted lipid carrier protein YhbT